eukprot:CAMPEP_0113669326 /NCGR_PEP_ID=MMETSP0038_2-20120614/4509_1 /TAXON_ID=2898 /ORGANISM="Cryptomonas paramecium" /LENGTH=144 /DNA_ID=CAMNT_0000585199 /DNA_START=350 /DNA_END=780 /DNA_ORIENTATION=+ /assembly_acc=CAM_ASM_000170
MSGYPESSSKENAIDFERIENGDDNRTTIMIKNVPNKYSQRALLDVIDVNHAGKYDFFYLPIDFRNKCNLGYAFLNFTSPKAILDFAKEFSGKRWDRYNSEKVCEICFGRIQGRDRLIEHFRSSRLMRKKDKYRPLLFDTAEPG